MHLEQAIHLPNGARAELWRRYPADEKFDSWKPNEIVLVSADGTRRTLLGAYLSVSLGISGENVESPPVAFTRRLDMTNDGHPDLFVEDVDLNARGNCCVSVGIFECKPDGSFIEYFNRYRPWPAESFGFPPDPFPIGSGWSVHDDGTLLYAVPEFEYLPKMFASPWCCTRSVTVNWCRVLGTCASRRWNPRHSRR